MRTFAFTAVALAAFAANSILCRRALRGAAIDPASFSSIRLAAGAATLALLARWTGRGSRGSWPSAVLLFLYAVPFSFAYVTLSAGTGALILFAAVQGTMLGAGFCAGERPHRLEWAGLGLAAAGLVYLVFPGISAPSPVGCALMAVAGAAWGCYSLRGRRSSSPLQDTGGNFTRSVPLALVVSVAFASHAELHVRGALLAITSGAIASGLGYAAWYTALRGLTATRAATVQLAVPVLTALGGVVFVSERMTARLIAATVLILSGIGLALMGRGT